MGRRMLGLWKTLRVTRKTVIAGVLSGLILCAGLLLRLHHSANLARMRLSDGSEVRVLAISYGHQHYIGRAPEFLYRTYDRLPKFVREIVPPPPEGHFGKSTPDQNSIAIWWVWIDPATEQPEDCPVGKAVMTLDSGKKVQLGWIYSEDRFRQILVEKPPHNSKRLHFSFFVNEVTQNVQFTISNPGYQR